MSYVEIAVDCENLFLVFFANFLFDAVGGGCDAAAAAAAAADVTVSWKFLIQFVYTADHKIR